MIEVTAAAVQVSICTTTLAAHRLACDLSRENDDFMLAWPAQPCKGR